MDVTSKNADRYLRRYRQLQESYDRVLQAVYKIFPTFQDMVLSGKHPIDKKILFMNPDVFFIPLDNSWFAVFAVSALMGFIVTELSRFAYVPVGPNQYTLVTYPVYRLTLLTHKLFQYAVHSTYLQPIAVADFMYNEGFSPPLEEEVYFTPFFTLSLSGSGRGGISTEDMLYNIRDFTDMNTIVTSLNREQQAILLHVRGGWATATVSKSVKVKQPVGIKVTVTGG